jgi:cytochrome c
MKIKGMVKSKHGKAKIRTFLVMVTGVSFMLLALKGVNANNSCSAGDEECMQKMHEHMHGETMHSEHMKGMHQHKEFQGMKNPLKKTPRSLYQGRQLYEKNCAICHGKMGNGDTPQGKALNPPAADFTDNVWKHGATDGEIFHVISGGVPGTGMTAWKNTLKENDIWKLVNYIKCFPEMKEAVYQCPMHPEVKGNLPDRCTKCGMYLEKVKPGKEQEQKEHEEHKH